MGFFDFFSRKNKPKRLEAPKKIKYDGTSTKIEFDPKRDWKDRDSQEKDELIKIYTLDGKKYINMEIPKGEQEVLEFNLARFEAKSDTAVENYGKQIKKFIIEILDEQVMFNDQKSRSSMIINTWISLDNLLKSKALEGTLSNEGKAVLRNVQAVNLNMARTVYLQRDSDGYLYDSSIKDDMKSVEEFLEFNEKQNLIDSTTNVEIPSKKLNENQYTTVELRKVLQGHIILCKYGNIIGIGEKNFSWEYGALDEAYILLANTKLGKDLDITKLEDKAILKERVKQVIVKNSLYLENMIEEYVYGEEGKNINTQKTREYKVTSKIDKNRENVIKMLNYSKKIFLKEELERRNEEFERIKEELKREKEELERRKEELERREDELERREDELERREDKNTYEDLDIYELAELSVVKNWEKSEFTEEQQDATIRLASETLKIKLSRLSNNEIASYIALNNKKAENIEILAKDMVLSDMAQIVLKEKFEKLGNPEIINLIALKNKGGEGVEPPVEDVIISNTAKSVLRDRRNRLNNKEERTKNSPDEEQL